MNFQMNRVWAMPSADTFDVEPIRNFVWKYLSQSTVSIDPFSRNKRWATYTNDINPNTAADWHMEATDFLRKLAADMVIGDLGIIDPPYSPRQISECYREIGRPVRISDTQNARLYSQTRELFLPLLAPSAVVLSFGWNSAGMGLKRGFEIEEILLVAHGAAHNDTICMAERRAQGTLFAPTSSDATDGQRDDPA